MTRDFNYKVYAILRATDKLILYVGETYETLENRLAAHVYKANSGRRDRSKWLEWIRNNCAERLEIIELESGRGVTLEKWAHERRIIKELTIAGCLLMNTVNGVQPSRRTRVAGYAPYRSAEELRKTEYYGLFAA